VSKWFFNERQRFIKGRIKTYGCINRKEIMDYYDIGSASASRDIKHYLKFDKEVTYDVSLKKYVT
jgi:hypothetical protein